jgi:hypothetical protein
MLFVAIATLAALPAGRAAADAEDDRAAAQQIAQDLKESGRLRDYRVGVKYQDGVAWLMGTVTSMEQKRTAEQIARQSAGVDRVISKLEIAANESSDEVQQAGGVAAEEYEQESFPAAVKPMPTRRAAGASNMPVPYARLSGQGPVQQANFGGPMVAGGTPPTGFSPTGMGQPVSYDHAQMPGYAWPSYAAYPNYAAVTYPQQYSPTAWPYIGPFYPYPQVPLGWRKVTLEWDDGWWFLDFKDCR